MTTKIKILILFLLVGIVAEAQQMLMHRSFQMKPQMSGVLIENAGANAAQREPIVRATLHARYTRFQFQYFSWNGSSSGNYNTYTANGLIPHPVLTMFPSSNPDPNPWVTSGDFAALEATVDDMLSVYQPVVLFIDNEELNTNYHSGSVAQYIAMCEVIQEVCKRHGVLMANGGYGDGFGTNCYAFRWIKEHYDSATARAFADEAGFTTGQYNAANNPNSNPVLETRFKRVDSVMSSDIFDCMNVHGYTPSVGNASTTVGDYTVWRYVKEAFTNGNPNKRRIMVCNETGQEDDNVQPALVTSILDIFWRLRYYVIDWWSGTGDALNATPLTNDAGVIQPNGEAFRDWQDEKFGSGAP
jgi:hypothetical protein